MQTDESISDVVAGPQVVDQSSRRVQNRLESTRQVGPKADQIQQNVGPANVKRLPPVSGLLAAYSCLTLSVSFQEMTDVCSSSKMHNAQLK